MLVGKTRHKTSSGGTSSRCLGNDAHHMLARRRGKTSSGGTPCRYLRHLTPTRQPPSRASPWLTPCPWQRRSALSWEDVIGWDTMPLPATSDADSSISLAKHHHSLTPNAWQRRSALSWEDVIGWDTMPLPATSDADSSTPSPHHSERRSLSRDDVGGTPCPYLHI